MRLRPPSDLDPDEEVFLCKITHEIFRSYDEFFERTILCNSLVWSCALTGRASLTYLEAVESERRARSSLQKFPQSLLLPLLLLVPHSSSRRLSELCEEVYAYTKERFFPGETVDVCLRAGDRQVCQVIQVLSPHSDANGSLDGPHLVSNGSLVKTEGDSIVISDSDEEQDTPPAHVNGNHGKPLPPAAFQYTVKAVNGETEAFTVKASQLSRKKNVLSREKLKLLFKQHCEPHNGAIILKSSSMSQYRLSEQNFSQFFPDDPPVFSPAPRGSPAQAGLSLLKATEEKLKLLQQKQEMAVHKTQKKNKNETDKRKHGEDRLTDERRREREHKDRLKRDRQEQRMRLQEEKEQRRLEREKEREKLKEEKKKFAERLKQMNKRQEDQECEDLQDLPVPVPVQTRLSKDLFGEALMILEFLKAFGEVFELKDEFPDGVSLKILEEALVGSDPEGPLCELLFFFLSAIFQSSDEEQEKSTPVTDQSEVVDEADPSLSVSVTTAMGAWPQVHQGRSLKQLDLDSCSLSEILRLKILSSSEQDDPCVELKNQQPHIISKLSTTPVYDLSPGEKLRILNALVGKLLTLGVSRDLIEDCVDEQKTARHELREIRLEQHRRRREEAALRVRQRREERLKEQEQRMREKEEKLREQENISQNRPALSLQQDLTDVLPEADLKPSPSLSPEELQEEQLRVSELLVRLQRASSCTALVPLGRDRWFRKYWLLPSSPGLFIEEDTYGLTHDMLRPQGGATEKELRPQGGATEGEPCPSGGATEHKPCPQGGATEHEPRPQGGATEQEPSPQGGATEHEPRPQGGATEHDQNRDNHSTNDPAPNGREESDSPPSDTLPSSVTPLTPSGSPLLAGAPRWWFYSSVDQFDRLVEALNPRGNRESSLKEALCQERERITASLQICEEKNYCYTEEQRFPKCTAAETVMEARLRDLLLDLEDRVYQGTLGWIKDVDRQVWRRSLETGDYQSLIDSCDQCMEEAESSDRSVVMVLASALAQIERGIERRFLKPPLGEEDAKKDPKTKKKSKKDDDQASEDGCKSVLEKWRESLSYCSSLSQVFVHLSTLERSILWSRSVLNARCRICRRKGDGDNMLLCDGCDRGHHTHCLRPKLKSIPDGDWFCPDCKPKLRSQRIPSRTRSSLDEQEEESEEEGEESDQEEESDEEEESEEEEPPSKKTSAPPPKGKNQSAASRSQQATPKNLGAAKASAPRSSGKKPPASRPAPCRSSTAHSERSTPKTTPKSSPKTSPQSAEPRPSNRRSSGRGHGVHELSTCENIIVDLVRHEDSWPFIKLVSRTQVPDYYDVIQKPIALSIIREKLNSCEYQNAGELIADVELMFSNCQEYNPRHSNEAKAGLRLQNYFLSVLEQVGLRHAHEPGKKRARR